ncbi:MAG: hypothetical protein A3H39_15980 [candidate division NC10 bacterium RIFCSPLOWO2_02_FULL_66_22]|nr:MAG: hypothetical protein A3H39_15980 [candidate division NC10 bacterium RIFCSPLOWO2_02_FULL_66_22]
MERLMCTVEDDRFLDVRRLNLGCGEFKKDGYMNTNKYAHPMPDVLHGDVSFPYFFDPTFRGGYAGVQFLL